MNTKQLMIVPLLLSMACSNSPSRETLASLLVLEDRRSFEFSITESSPRGTDQQLAVTCTSGCVGRRPYTSPARGYPLGLYRPSDADSLVIVLWGAGNSVNVQIVQLRGDSVREVFARNSIGPPRITYEGAGLRVSLTEYVESASERRRLVTRHWSWTGDRFNESRD